MLYRAAHALSLAGLVAVFLGVLLSASHPAWRETYAFHPAQDPLWAGFLAQLIHLDAAHTALNLTGLAVLCLAACWLDRLVAVMPALLASALGVCLGLQMESPQIAWYVGLSGALYGAWAWLSAELAASRSPPLHVRGVAGLACLAIGIKAALGLGSPAILGDLPVAHQAHLYGYAGGLVFTACWLMGPYCGRRRPTRAT